MKKLIALISTKGKTKEKIKEEMKQALKNFIEKSPKKKG
jgi:predicted RNase H-like HicB family nuclease